MYPFRRHRNCGASQCTALSQPGALSTRGSAVELARSLECIRRKTLGGIPRTVATGVRTGGQAEKVFAPAVGQEPTGSTAMSSGRGGGPSAPNLH